MVGVAQLVERWIVVPDVTGPSPVTHPCFFTWLLKSRLVHLGECLATENANEACVTLAR